MAIRPNFTGNYNQDFVNDPNAFMDWHLVVSSVKTSRIGAEFTEKVTFKHLPTSFCMKTDNAGGGRSIPVLILRNARDGEDSIDAYVCDYTSGTLQVQMIDRAAKYCFTFAMDGCSFGIGNPTPEGAADLLGLSDQEERYIELKVALSQCLKHRRQKSQLTQAELARLVRSSPSRIAKMESGDPTVSIDLLVKSLLALGTTRREIAKAIA